MNEPIKNLEQTPVFQIDGGELFCLVSKEYQLGWNPLSPFANQPAAVETCGPDTMALSKDVEFQAVVKLLAEPDLKLQYNQAGPRAPLEASTVYIKRVGAAVQSAVLHNDGGRLFIIYLRDIEELTTYFKNQYGALVVNTGINVLAEQVPLEVWMCIMNLADCYKRAYLYDMLGNETAAVDALYEDEYLAVLEQSLKSGDLRWLVPSFLRLIPDLQNVSLDFQEAHLETAKRLQFLHVTQEDNRRIYSLHSSSKYMGLEFTNFWKFSLGLTFSHVAGKVGHYYMATTDEINHFVTLIPKEVGYDVTHEILDFDQVGSKVGTLIEEMLKSAPVAVAEVKAVVAAPTAGKKFCSKCGTKVPEGASFCAGCGSKI